MIALGNVLVLAGVVVGSVAAGALTMGTPLTAGPLLLLSSGLALAAMAWALWLLPYAMLRLVLFLLILTVYRLKIVHRERVPERGGAVLVANHLSFVDGLFVCASVGRPVRPLVESIHYSKWWLRPFMKAGGAIPISSEESPRATLRARRDAGRYLDDGEVVCLFPEGQVSRTGTMQPFQRGLERLVKGRDVPIVPIYLDRVWGSLFSRKGGRFLLKVPERLPYPVTVVFGEPRPTSSSLWQIRQAVRELSTEAWEHRRDDRGTLHRQFIRTARRRPAAFAFSDPSRPRVSRLRTLAGAVAIGRRLRTDWADQRRVGVLLPPGVAGAMVNIAAAAAGRSAVNLNYTAGADGMASAIRQADIGVLLTSRAFLEQGKVSLPGVRRVVYLEDLTDKIRGGERLFALLAAALAPARGIERLCGAERPPSLDDELTVIFSSGSTGEPKGAVLSYDNVVANVEAAGEVFDVGPPDRLLGILPLFHSFGYMGLWFSCVQGVGTACYPSAVDAESVGRLVVEKRLTILIATPTFLQLYLRRAQPGHFGSLRMVLTGAEKLPQSLADRFEEKFGIRPIEGYGVTECSPVVATSTLDVRYQGIYQRGARRGTVGQPLPGVSVRVVDPETFEPLGPEEAGMLLVRGPNVMQGYLGREDLTREVMWDGWYITGDIAVMHEDGFLSITDRLSRFSKIGGEMVPHGRIEQALQQAVGTEEPTFAVTAVPDEKKGKSLAVVHICDEARIGELLQKLSDDGLPRLYLPRADHFVKVDELPILGTGKLDLKAVKRIAREKLGKDDG